jgi:hypothetical protein
MQSLCACNPAYWGSQIRRVLRAHYVRCVWMISVVKTLSLLRHRKVNSSALAHPHQRLDCVVALEHAALNSA